MRIKQTLMERPVDCLVSDSLAADLKEICKGQRHITNQNWIYALESDGGMVVIENILKPYIADEFTRDLIYAKIVTLFSRSKSLK
jgi:hypothetical protein